MRAVMTSNETYITGDNMHASAMMCMTLTISMTLTFVLLVLLYVVIIKYIRKNKSLPS